MALIYAYWIGMGVISVVVFLLIQKAKRRKG